MRLRGAVLGMLLMAGAGLGSACGAPQPEATPAPKTGTGELRTDPAPLLERFPVLDGVTDVTWMSGTLGDDSLPGPSTYWIDAVVTLPPGQAGEWRDSLALTAADEPPEVVPDLADFLPPDVVTSDELDREFAMAGWQVEAYLEDSGDRLVLVAVGE